MGPLVRSRLLTRIGSGFVALAIAGSLQAVAPVHASVSNPVLGSFDAADVNSNPYATCIATTLVGNGITFSNLGVLTADLAALWPSIPTSVADVCKNAVDNRFNQVCLVPNSTFICQGIGADQNRLWVQQAAALDTWDLISDPQSQWFGSAVAHYPANAVLATGPQASITFNIGQLPQLPIGQGLTGSISALPFMIYGRTPSGGAAQFHLHISDNHGRVYDGEYCFSAGACNYGFQPVPNPEILCIPPIPPGNINNCNSSINPYPDGFFAPSIHNARLVPSGSQIWPCPNPTPGGPADCSGWQVTFTLTFHGGTSDGGTPFTATSAGVSRLWLQYSTSVATYVIDSAAWDDPRWQFSSPIGFMQSLDSRAATPEAVINLSPVDINCIVGLDIFSDPHHTCHNEIGGVDLVVQSPQSQAGPRYVALGDSYAAGEGAPPFFSDSNTSTDQCHRSINAYAIKILNTPGVPSDVNFGACSGAEMKDFYGPFYGEQRQLDRLSGPPVTLLTLSVGGNDIGFVDIATTCTDVRPAAILNPQYQSNCGNFLEQAGQLEPLTVGIPHLSTGITEDGVSRSLPALYRDLKSQALNARVFVVGYPDPLPRNPTGDCELNLHYENGVPLPIPYVIHQQDIDYLNKVFAALNTEVRSEAANAGFYFVDNTHTFDGGDLCGSNPFTNGVTWTPDHQISKYSYHPNVNGQAALKTAVENCIEGVSCGGAAISTVSISQGQTIQQPLTVSSSLQQLVVQTAWPGSDVQLSLRSPSGAVYDRATVSPLVVHQLQSNAETLAIGSPEAGQWTIQLFGSNVSAPSEPVRIDATQIPLSDFAPAALISASTDRGIAPLTVQFSSAQSATFGGASIASYRWDFGDGSAVSTAPNPVHVFASTGLYTVSVAVTDTNGQSDIARQPVHVTASDQAPVAQMFWDSLNPSSPNQVTFDGHTSNDMDGQIASYSWDFGDGTTASGPALLHSFATSGSYGVRLTVTDNGGLTASTCELVTTGQLASIPAEPCPPLTITASDGTMTYGGSPPAISAGFVGFIDGDGPASLSTSPTCASTGTATTAAGTYPGATSCSGAIDPKYLISYATGTLTVNPAQLTVTPDNQSIVYGSPIPSPAYEVSGFVNGQDLSTSGVSGTASCSTGATTASPAGTYPITCTQGSLAAANYSFSFGGGSLLIVKHPATVGFTGPTFFSTGTGTTASVTLIGRLTASPGGAPDLRLAAPVFNLYRSTNTSMATPDATCAAAVDAAGGVSCTIPNLGIDNWTVILQIPNSDGYFIGPSASAVVLTVFQPTAGVFATGGGWIVDPSYQNVPVGISSTNNHGNFGFNVRYVAGTTTPQGQFVYVFRGADGFDYQVKSTSWTGGGAAFGSNYASFAGQASVTVIDPATGSPVSGLGGAGFTYRVDVTTGGSAGPTFAFSVYDSFGNLYHQASTTASPIPVGGGNVVIHS